MTDGACAISQAATASLHGLSSKLVKARHSLHTNNLQCEATRITCDKSRHQVEKNDAEIAALEAEEQKLKLKYVETKLAFEKVLALKHQSQSDLKEARAERLALTKELHSIKGILSTRQYEWTRVHEVHLKTESSAYALAAKLEAVEKEKESQKQIASQHQEEASQYLAMVDALQRELDVINASAESV